MAHNFLEGLNPQQQEAVLSVEGPLLILAGAGSGKTRVLTHRVAHLVQDYGVPLSGILAVTFSNKAAREMHDRVKKLLHDNSDLRMPWISTFHSVCVRLLRMHGEFFGLSKDFSIYDEADQLQVIKQCYEQLGISDKAWQPKVIHNRIGEWKNDGKLPEDIKTTIRNEDEVAANIYQVYQKLLKESQAVDFDDLLLYGYRLFAEQPEIAQFYRDTWSYVMVDEFQDTNTIQYKLIKEILNPQNNICVVGDDDQSIYSWRGAKIKNILEFDKEFENCKVIRLEQNYRSTGNILKAADAVISKNEMRHPKTLWTEQGVGERISLKVLEDDRGEARYIVDEIVEAKRRGIPGKEIAVLYRVNSLSRVFEEECLRRRVLYKIIGGFRFYERKEIKDAMAYLKVLLNPSDTAAFKRAIQTPTRGVGAASLEKLVQASSGSIIDFVKKSGAEIVSGKAKKGLAEFLSVINALSEKLDQEISLVEWVTQLLELIRYRDFLREDRSDEGVEREANIDQWLTAIQEFEELWHPQGDMPPTLRAKLRDFLERTSLLEETEAMADMKDEQVTFMSMHAAKGLEFRLCFIAGLEEGLFPSARSFDSYDQAEEERRLCYVGITRAREKLILTRATRRRRFGSMDFNLPSRFLKDIPAEILATTYESTEAEELSAPKTWKKSFARPSNEYAQESFDDFSQDSGFEDSLYKQGDKVKHASFGEGVVQRIEKMGEQECLTISFKLRGPKKVMASFVQKVG